MGKKKRKHRLRGLWITLLVLFILIALPVAAAYICFFDPDTKVLDVKDNYQIQEVGNTILVDSLDNTRSQEKIALVLTEKDLNQILYTASAKLRNEYIKKVYMDIKGSIYRAYVDLEVPLFKTRACIEFTLETNQDAFVFRIKDIKLGRIGGIYDLVSKILQKFVKEESINQMFEQAGLSMEYNAAEGSLVYKKADIVNDIQKMSGSNNDIYYSMLTSIFEHNLVEFTTETNNFFEAYMDLADMKTNPTYCVDPHNIINGESWTSAHTTDEVDEKVKAKLMTLVENNAFGDNPTNDNYQNIFKYLFLGYDGIKGNEQINNLVKSIDMTSIGLSDDAAKEAYTGFGISATGGDLLTIMKNAINVEDIVLGRTDSLTLLSEEQINYYVAGQNILGYACTFSRKTEEGWKINYVTIDNFYCNIYHDDTTNEDIVNFFLGLNINGRETTIIFNTKCPEEGIQNDKITFKIGKVLFGTKEAAGLEKTFLTILKNAAEKADGTIIVDAEKEEISFSFTNVVHFAEEALTNKVREIYPSAPAVTLDGKVKITTQGQNVKGNNGEFKLTLTSPIMPTL